MLQDTTMELLCYKDSKIKMDGLMCIEKFRFKNACLNILLFIYHMFVVENKLLIDLLSLTLFSKQLIKQGCQHI